MTLPGSWIASGGVEKVSMPTLISRLLGYSETQALKLLRNSEVRVDSVVTHLRDIPVEDIAGREISVRGEVAEVPTDA